MDFHPTLDGIIVNQSNGPVMIAGISQHIADKEFTGIAGSNDQHSPSHGTRNLHPFSEPSHRQADARQIHSTQDTGQYDDGTGIRHPSQQPVQYPKRDYGSCDRSPQYTSQIVETNIPPQATLNAEKKKSKPIDGQDDR